MKNERDPILCRRALNAFVNYFAFECLMTVIGRYSFYFHACAPSIIHLAGTERVTHQKHGNWKWLTAFLDTLKAKRQYFPAQLKYFWIRSPVSLCSRSQTMNCHFPLCGCPTTALTCVCKWCRKHWLRLIKNDIKFQLGGQIWFSVGGFCGIKRRFFIVFRAFAMLVTSRRKVAQTVWMLSRRRHERWVSN